MVDKKLVATTVSSRETGLKRRADTVTTSKPEEEKAETTEIEEQQQKKKDGIRISFRSKNSRKIYFINEKKRNKQKNRKAAARSKSKKIHGID